MFTLKRSAKNPILSPNDKNAFESYCAFNPNPIEVGSGIHILYRAQSIPEPFEHHSFSLSVIGRAKSRDGVTFSAREKFLYPEHIWERFGLEDPRVTKIGGKYYIFYTALSTFPFGKEGIKVAVAISKDMHHVSEKHLVTPFNAKAMVLFPEKINGKYVALLSVDTDNPPSKIAVAEFSKIEDMWNEKYWNKWYKEIHKHTLDIPKLPTDQVEVGAVPLKTKDGWLLIYSHINNYYSQDKVFGVRALLLDLKNPKKIVGKTRGALFVPEEPYEKYGQAANIVFPSGALIRKNKLLIYYGATDTTCAVAEVKLEPLLTSMKEPRIEDGFKRLSPKPILTPTENEWEKRAVFNPAVITIGQKTYIVYRAMSMDNTSVIGLAETTNGIDIDIRYGDPIYSPRESFEEKRIPGGNSGCEDPRLVLIGDTIYMCYTAYNGVTPPAVAITSISVKNFISHKWIWKKPVVITQDSVDDKDGCIHPEKIAGKYFLYHRVHNYICGDFGATTEFKERNNFKNNPILLPRKGMWDSVKVGISAPPIKTPKGWLLLYHGVSEHSTYRIGAALLDLKDPTKVLSRSTDALFEPREEYEKMGQINNVVFPCGATLKGGIVYMYYGGADTVINVASIPLASLLDSLS